MYYCESNFACRSSNYLIYSARSANRFIHIPIIAHVPWEIMKRISSALAINNSKVHQFVTKPIADIVVLLLVFYTSEHKVNLLTYQGNSFIWLYLLVRFSKGNEGFIIFFKLIFQGFLQLSLFIKISPA